MNSLSTHGIDVSYWKKLDRLLKSVDEHSVDNLVSHTLLLLVLLLLLTIIVLVLLIILVILVILIILIPLLELILVLMICSFLLLMTASKSWTKHSLVRRWLLKTLVPSQWPSLSGVWGKDTAQWDFIRPGEEWEIIEGGTCLLLTHTLLGNRRATGQGIRVFQIQPLQQGKIPNYLWDWLYCFGTFTPFYTLI